MGNIASVFTISGNHKPNSQKIFETKLTTNELQTLHQFGLGDEDTELDKTEFLLLGVLRLGLCAPHDLKDILEKFKDMDVSGDGKVDFQEFNK